MRPAAASRSNLRGLDGNNTDKKTDVKPSDNAGIAHLGDVFGYGLVRVSMRRIYLVKSNHH